MSESAPSSWRWQLYARVASTQDLAIFAARAGDLGRLAVLADRQTSGRGSRGRRWVAPAGNLNLSVLLRPGRAKPDPGAWAMLAGVALHDALAPFADGLTLKWPNDVLLGGAKLGGVLIDSAVRGDGLLDWVVLGFGANLAAAPMLADRATSHLPAPAPAARAVAQRLLEQLDRHADTDIRQSWLARGHQIGTLLDVVTPHRRVNGRFAGLNSAGELLLEGVAHPISSAEIFLSSRSAPCS